MRRIAVGVQQTHCHGLDAETGDFSRERRDLRLIERRKHLAGGSHALGKFECQFARNQRARPMKEQIERIGAIATADGVNVAHAGRGNERGLGALVLQHRIDGDGRAMDQFVHGGKIAVGKLQRVGNALGRIGRDGRCL